jgi:hypothetical protein
LLVDGEASFSTQGTIKDDYPVPTTFTSKIVSSAETSDVAMALDEGGNVKELTATPPPRSDVVPVTNAHSIYLQRPEIYGVRRMAALTS